MVLHCGGRGRGGGAIGHARAERLSWWWLGIALAIVVACPTLRDPGSFYPTDVGQQDGYEVASSRQWG